MSYRKTSLEKYKLDYGYYVSMPSYAWDAMLLMSKIEIDLITD